LDRLRSGPVNLACHVKPLGMGIDTQLDRNRLTSPSTLRMLSRVECVA
jgi:hypothetical protein